MTDCALPFDLIEPLLFLPPRLCLRSLTSAFAKQFFRITRSKGWGQPADPFISWFRQQFPNLTPGDLELRRKLILTDARFDLGVAPETALKKMQAGFAAGLLHDEGEGDDDPELLEISVYSRQRWK